MPWLPDEKRRQHFADDVTIASEMEAVAKDAADAAAGKLRDAGATVDVT